MIEIENKYWPCNHVYKMQTKNAWVVQPIHGYESGELIIEPKFCPQCGKQRHQEHDELDKIIDKYKSTMWDKDRELIKKDLKAWKEKDQANYLCGFNHGKEVAKEEKPKLWKILAKHDKDWYLHEGIQRLNYSDMAKSAIEAVERIIDELIIGEQMIIVNKNWLKEWLREKLL